MNEPICEMLQKTKFYKRDYDNKQSKKPGNCLAIETCFYLFASLAILLESTIAKGGKL